MSYDIELVHKNGETALVDTPFLMRGGTVPAIADAYGNLRQALQREAHVNITYNYARYYYEATETDERFFSSEKKSLGLRALYGKTPKESLPMLTDMVERILKKYRDADGNWITTHRTKVVYLDKQGNVAELRPGNLSELTQSQIEYDISEGNVDDYWEATAANAILPLMDMIHLAAECLMMDVVWNGD